MAILIDVIVILRPNLIQSKETNVIITCPEDILYFTYKAFKTVVEIVI